MAAFDHVVLLPSFVYALALAHLFSGVGRLIQHRASVQFSGLLTINMLTVAVLIFSN